MMTHEEQQPSTTLARAAARLAALRPGPHAYLEVRAIAAELDVYACCLAQAEREKREALHD